MRIYNTLSKKLDDLQPVDAEVIKIYSCGPTVYDHIHIGNLSSFIFADSLRRALIVNSYKVQHVMNFTDVDDKTIRRSQEKYHQLDPLEALLKLTTEYTEVFLTDMAAVGNSVSEISFIKATDSIAAMQDLIGELHDQGFAYIADDGIYFSIAAYIKSGKTYGQLTEINTAGASEARIQNDEYDKESAQDFALWKTQKPGEPAWDFEIEGRDLKGRPGWHIECSAMSRSKLGQPFDIHTGGVDLVFPHHENEIAQSTATGGDSLAQVFAHNEHLLIDGQKMSKSFNNFYTLSTIIDREIDPLAFRVLVLQSHYRKQAHFSWDNLTAAQNRLRSWQALADLRWQARQTGDPFDAHQTEQFIRDKLADDLNLPQAITALDTLADEVAAIGAGSLDSFVGFLEFADSAFGLDLSHRQDISGAQKQLIEEREASRQSQDWSRSDQLRDQLAEQGIGLKDTPHGAIWQRL